MAPNPQCSALAAAKERKGLSYGEIAQKIGKSERHVVDICTGKQRPSHDEYQQLAVVLDIRSPIPHDPAHPNA